MSRIKEIRDAKKALRNAIAQDVRSQAEKAIVSNLASLEFVSDAETLGIYLANDGEPDIAPLGENGRIMALPVALAALGEPTIKFGRYKLGDALIKGRFRILVPEVYVPVEPSVVLSPLVAFDNKGARVGRGGGFYDTYFANHDVIRVGVGFELQLEENIPTEPHDQYLDYVVTEEKVRSFDRS